MGRSSLSSACAHAIRRYRRSAKARQVAGVCRFDPTCSRYALEAFETRALPVAVGMTVSRLLRCNPLVRRVTGDPVRRQRRGVRPGTFRTWSVVLMLAGFAALFVLAGTAAADAPTGGCTGSANGRRAAKITRDNPLKVKEHSTVSAKGTTPPGKSGPNQTHVEVFLIDPIGGVTTSDHAGDGDTWSSSSVKIDDYLEYGVGTYKAEVTNTGAGWKCTFVGYIELDGNPLTKPVGIAAAGITLLGAAGGLLAPRRAASPQWERDQVQSAAYERNPMDTIVSEGDKALAAADAETAAAREPDVFDLAEKQIEMIRQGRFGCLFCAVGLLTLPLAAMPVFGTGGGAGAVAAPRGPVLWTKDVWRHGHPVLGFISGLLFGLGATALLWQYDVWLLNIFTAIVVPVVVGVLFGVVAWIGRRYRIVARARTDEPPPPPPAPAEAVAESGTGTASAAAAEAPPPVADEPSEPAEPAEPPSTAPEEKPIAWTPEPDEPPPPPPAT